MKIKSKLTFMMVGISAVFTVALMVTIVSLYNQSKESRRLIDGDVASLMLVRDLYANGLQSGQSTRNLLLNPADTKAIDNYRKAAAAFSDGLTKLSQNYAEKAEQKKQLEALASTWNEDSFLKEKAQLLVTENKLEEAKQLLIEKETVKWREVKELIFTFESQQKKDIEAAVAASASKAQKARWIAVSLLILALAASAAGVIALVRMIAGPLVLAGDAARHIAEGDLTIMLPVKSDDEIGDIGKSINNISKQLSDVIAHITESSCAIASSGVQLQGNTERISVNLYEVESQTISLATASEEMAATSADIARNCHLAATSSAHASKEAQAGVVVVSETIADMQRIADRVRSSATTVESLGQRSEQIGAIVGTIEDIADQTNLLALNAAIEAARAGDQGRGFAVVADEVRALAERTTRATHEISDMIKRIQQETQSAVTVMETGVVEVERGMETSRRSEETLEGILSCINEVTSQIDQIATASEEQTATTQEIAGNIHRVTSVVDVSAHSSRENAQAVAQLTGLAEELLQLVRPFKVSGNDLLILDIAKNDHKMFVNSIRSAVLGLNKLDSASISTHRNCRFGKWYSEEGQSMCGSLNSFKAIDAPHDRIHSLAKDAVTAMNSGNTHQANQILATVEELSDDMMMRLDAIKLEHGHHA